MTESEGTAVVGVSHMDGKIVPPAGWRAADGASPAAGKRVMQECAMRSALAAFLATLLLASAPAVRADTTIYADSLAAGWENYSWATTDFASSATVHSGTKSISATTSGSGYQAVYLHSGAPITVAGSDSLTFWMYGTGQVRHFVLQLNNDSAHKTDLTLAPSAWTKFTVPFSTMAFAGALSEFWIQENDGLVTTFYVDDVSLAVAPVAPQAITLSVDANAARKSISPDIYGMNYAPEALAAELRLPVRRWGGNATSRYNYLNDISNHGSDYFFENIPQGPGTNLPAGSAANLFIDQDRRTATRTMMTVPATGWVSKIGSPTDHPFACGFKRSKYPGQLGGDNPNFPVGTPEQDFDPYDFDCGPGRYPDGSFVAGNDPTDTSTAIGASFVTQWVNDLKARYGAASAGGVAFYSIDNEPALWNSTHRDVHPNPLTYQELVDAAKVYGKAVKDADPTAKTIGPAEYGWCAFFYSAADGDGATKGCAPGADSAAHGGLQIMDYYLQQLRAHEVATGLRVLDYFDLHYYPQNPGVSLSPAGSAATQAMRLRATRSLWDPAYVDESWIGQGMVNGGIIRFLPRMRDWVASNYPGTKLAISEYNFGGLEHINGALAQADVLGIFGREGLDLATHWDPPTSAQPGAFAFRMYRNYDGAGHGFGETSVQSVSSDQSQLAVYGAQRASDNALTLMVINKTGGDITSALSLSGFTPSGNAAVYRYSSASLGAIQHLADQPVAASGFQATYPANSITLYVIQQAPATPPPPLTPIANILWQKSTGRTAMWQMNGATQVGGREFFGDGTNWVPKLVGDLNGDGQMDVLFERTTDKATAVWTLQGTTQTGGALLLGAQAPATTWRAKFLADFDGDGKDDILWEKADGTTAIWLMNGTAYAGGGVILGPGTGWHVKFIGDFDGDGKADLLWENDDGASALWLMNGLAQVGGGRLFAGGTGWLSTKVADLDGNGKSDILWTHTDGRVAAWIMNGATQAGGAVLLPAGTGYAVVATGDINGDGRADIVFAKADGTTAWWAMNGTASIGGGPIFSAGSTQVVKRMLDFSGDGKADLLVVNASGDTSLAIFNGAAFNTPTVVLPAAYGYAPVTYPE